MENLLDFMNTLILWHLGKNCRAKRRFCWNNFAICLNKACEATSVLLDLLQFRDIPVSIETPCGCRIFDNCSHH